MKLSKTIAICMALGMGLVGSGNAADFTIPHQFNPGEILSADVMNEVFSKIGEVNRSITEETLVGEWSCDSFVRGGYFIDSVPEGWSVDSEYLVGKMEDSTLTFTNDGDGTYTVTSSTPSPFVWGSSETTNSGYRVHSNLLFFWYKSTNQQTYQIQMIGDSRLILVPVSNDAFPTVVCDKTNLPPATPSDLSVSLSGSTATLTWADNSDDESSFNVYRRDTLTGDYNVIASPSADATTYTDTLTSAGTYWYRVSAVNANGESLGSNVVKVEVE